MMPSGFWAFAVIGGPILLGLALLWGLLQARRRDRQIDPVRSGSDPSLGMEGADLSPDTIREGARPADRP
jgi:hypothetical protein